MNLRFSKLLEIDIKFAELISIIHNNGGVIVFVGGIVRNILLGLTYKDCDAEIYFMNYELLYESLSKSFELINVGKNYRVVKIKRMDIDICIARIEENTGMRHRDLQVYESAYVSYKRIAQRRDFTINALGYCPYYKELFDPFNGVSDLVKKKIKHISIQNFTQDPLRYLRAFYFSCKLGFKIDNLILSSSKNCTYLEHLSIERIGNEIAKMLNCLHYLKGIRLLIKNTLSAQDYEYLKFLNFYVHNVSSKVHSIVRSLYYKNIENLVKYRIRTFLLFFPEHTQNIVNLSIILPFIKKKEIENFVIWNNLMHLNRRDAVSFILKHVCILHSYKETVQFLSVVCNKKHKEIKEIVRLVELFRTDFSSSLSNKSLNRSEIKSTRETLINRFVNCI